MRERARSLLIRLTAICIGLAVAMAGAEVFLRLTGRGPIGMVRTVSAKDFGRIPGMFAPNQATVSRENAHLPYHITIDSLGFRGAPFPRTKSGDEFRLVLLGDSFTFGAFVDDDETLPARLQAELRPHCRTARVINGGLGGSTIVDQLALLHRAMAVGPDAVIVEFTENDVTDLGVRSMFDRLADNRALKSRFPMAMVHPLLRESALWNLALKVRDARLKRGDSPVSLADTPEAVATARARYAALLRVLRDSVGSHGTPVWLVTYPNYQVVDGSGSDEQLRWVASVAHDLNVPAIELLGPLRATGLDSRTLYLLPYDGHPSAKGYAIAGSALAAALLQDSLITARCQRRALAAGPS